MTRARLILTEPVTLHTMSAPPEGSRSIPQDEIDSLAGRHLAQPPPGVSVVGYSGPLVASDPPRLPPIQLLMLAESGWTIISTMLLLAAVIVRISGNK